jgi:cardiolipin synthase A/B
VTVSGSNVQGVSPAPTPPPDALIPLWGRALDRTAGSPRIDGNLVRLQFEGPDTFDSWLESIQEARRFVHFENYILRDDAIGRTFRDALIARARDGIQVRVLYDWVGCWATPRRFWKPFREAGVELQAFNRPSIRDPFGLFQRDHRKLVCVDGTVAYVGGMCVGQEWAGTATEPPWRDTGVEIRGPAAAVAARGFERIWGEGGRPVSPAAWVAPESVPAAGDTPVWVIEGVPFRTRVYRVAQLMATGARSRVWITDPYFVAPRPVAEALASAARDGVDVRILVPAHNNWPWVGSLSRGGYRFLLEAGVRIFEWQGPMIHAKTAVTDGLWSRIGSSNLNAASLLGNWEIDVAVQDEGMGRQMEGLFLADLASSVEIVLPWWPGTEVGPVPREATGPGAPRVAPLEPEGSLGSRLEEALRQHAAGSTGFRIADLARLGTALGAAIAGQRVLGREDRTALGTSAAAILVLAGLMAIFPRVTAWTLAGLLGWLGLVMGVRAVLQARGAHRMEREMAVARRERADR